MDTIRNPIYFIRLVLPMGDLGLTNMRSIREIRIHSYRHEISHYTINQRLAKVRVGKTYAAWSG